MTWLMVTWALSRVEMKLTAWNLRSLYNGYGAMESVVKLDAEAPMCYRVLVPIVHGWLMRVKGLQAQRYLVYTLLKGALWLWALVMVEVAIGSRGTLVVAALIAATFHFEYWDAAVELGAIGAALTGKPELIVIGAALHGLSRPETLPLMALTAFLCGGWYAGAVASIMGGGLALAVRVRVGRRKLYCARWMLRQNLQDVRGLWRNSPVHLSEIAAALVITVVVIMSVMTSATAAGIVPMMYLMVGWTMGRAAESRIFTPCLIWIGMVL